MSEENKTEVGAISWVDLAVNNAEELRDFYSKVVGWNHQALSMGEYDDFIMTTPESGKGIAGVCHARGSNAGLPAQWLIYITVENLEKSINQCNESGGKVIFGPKDMGDYGMFCVIEDPVGAVAGLIQPKK
jgi:uncharacterized protein